jgi:hypothetical protein
MAGIVTEGAQMIEEEGEQSLPEKAIAHPE